MQEYGNWMLQRTALMRDKEDHSIRNLILKEDLQWQHDLISKNDKVYYRMMIPLYTLSYSGKIACNKLLCQSI